MIRYLFSIIGSILSYDIARSITTFESRFSFLNNAKISGLDVMKCFWYVDILILILMLCFSPLLKKYKGINIFNTTYLRKNKIIFLILSIPVLSSVTKSFVASNISGNVILTYSMLCPFVSLILSKIIFKEEKISNLELKVFVFGFLGFFITKLNKIEGGFDSWLLFYVLINSVSILAVRYISKKKNQLDGIIVENMIYVAIGLTGFSFYGGFSLKILFSWQILLVAIPSIIHHIFVILGNQKTKNTIEIIILDIFKILITLISAYLLLGKTLNIFEYIGCFIMLTITIYYFLIKNNVRQIR